MISILLPSRGRIPEFRRMFESAMRTAAKPEQVEVVVRFDDDDKASAAAARSLGVTVLGSITLSPIVLTGPRIREMTRYWNECFDACHGDIVCQGNDDVIFQTPTWDTIVEDAFAEVPDRILMVHGNDNGGHFGRFGPHPFVHRKWVKEIGYFIPPYFCSDNGDAWINDVANGLGRRRYIPFVMEHMHPAYGKAPVDLTHQERLTRHAQDDPDQLYWKLTPERVECIERLRKLIYSDPNTTKWIGSNSDPQRSMGKCLRCASWRTVLVNGVVTCNGCGYERRRADQ